MRSPQKRTRRHRNRRNRTPSGYIPLDIIEIIFTYLPIQLAVQSSVVAKRFKDVWKFSRLLDFDREFARNFTNLLYYRIVNNVLGLHKGDKIQSFSIYFDPTGLEDQVRRWISRVISKGIEQLDLDFFGIPAGRKFALGDFTFPLLSVLKLSFCDFSFSWTTNQLPLLSTLILKHVNVAPKMIEKVMENCKHIETIDMIYCKMNGKVSILASDLKRFTTLRIGDCTHICHIGIDAPSLRTFHYCGKLPFLLIRDVTALSDVLLNFKAPTSAFVPSYVIKSILWEVCHTQVLTITGAFLEGLASAYYSIMRGLDEAFTLWNLKELQLFVEGSLICNAYDIGSFVVRCPHLERLFIDIKESSMETSVVFQDEQSQALEMISDKLPCLKVIRLKNFQFKKNELRLVRFLLQKAGNLELLYITTPKFSQREVRGARLKGHNAMERWKTSPNANIVISSFFDDKCQYHPIHNYKWY